MEADPCWCDQFAYKSSLPREIVGCGMHLSPIIWPQSTPRNSAFCVQSEDGEKGCAVM